MPIPNTTLSDPLTRMENTAGKNELVRREVQKMQEALQAFEVAFKAGETSGFKDSGTKSQGG
jgi:hypothetical protein